MKTIFAFAALAVLAAAPAMAEDSVTVNTHSQYTPDHNGGYQATTSHEVSDPNGTSVSASNKKVEMDATGIKESSAQVHSSTDAQGLSNRSTTEVKSKAIGLDGTEVSHNKTVEETSTHEQH
ncbi:MAG: hypothetical protein M3N08_05985 [Pseudomonadota bacterium]|nr:hypothetical protein [Pseudomonadota bacterium]